MGTSMFLDKFNKRVKEIDLSIWGKVFQIKKEAFYGIYKNEVKIYTRLTIEEAIKKSEWDPQTRIERE